MVDSIPCGATGATGRAGDARARAAPRWRRGAPCLPSGDEGAPYDRRAAAYDRLVASPLYNRLLWRASPRTYAAFAAEALRAGDGPLLDVACGSGVFTAAAYRHAERPLVLADRSLAMLGRARRRIGPAAPAVSLVQADLFDLPFAVGAFETVACHGALHVFDDLPEALRALRAQLVPGGTLYVTSLVAETPVAARYLALLHRAGEVATPRGRPTYWPPRAPSSATSPRAASAPCASSPPAPEPPGRLGLSTLAAH